MEKRNNNKSFHRNKHKIFVRIDETRKKRCGFPEFVYGANKTVEQLKSIISKLKSLDLPILITKLSEEKYQKIKDACPKMSYDPLAKVLYEHKQSQKKMKGEVTIITAGTSDIPIAMEAKHTIELCNYQTIMLFDIGVAGIHRLFEQIDIIENSEVIVCIAGMEGALPSVVAGLVSCPVIAVPTSVGYGASLNGFTAMFAMLNSCANGVMVMNIDNGFGAGCAAVRILNGKYNKQANFKQRKDVL